MILYHQQWKKITAIICTKTNTSVLFDSEQITNMQLVPTVFFFFPLFCHKQVFNKAAAVVSTPLALSQSENVKTELPGRSACSISTRHAPNYHSLMWIWSVHLSVCDTMTEASPGELSRRLDSVLFKK